MNDLLLAGSLVFSATTVFAAGAPMSAAQANAAVESLSQGCESRLRHLDNVVNVFASLLMPYGSENVGPTDDRSREGIDALLARKHAYWTKVRNALYAQEEAAEARWQGVERLEDAMEPARERARAASRRRTAASVIQDIEADRQLIDAPNRAHAVRYARLQAKKSLFRGQLCGAGR